MRQYRPLERRAVPTLISGLAVTVIGLGYHLLAPSSASTENKGSQTIWTEARDGGTFVCQAGEPTPAMLEEMRPRILAGETYESIKADVEQRARSKPNCFEILRKDANQEEVKSYIDRLFAQP